ncbi:hypothetical protein [Actinoallomurus iriomotensis]|uniref:Lipoprotein n=1 Tax=Actinoallomurus iriomotensis TaxID=478107 RepID=A0A9W6W488_9ACTN|nr:hypothetical protein [Actinoallomurus iriomotensis]GLY89692.1 hypothetical protein Airi02_076210 [Actinoallomurus iriomotensis]
MPINRLVLSATALSCAALVACDRQPTSCSCPAAPSWTRICGTRLEGGPGSLRLDPSPPAKRTGRVSSVRHSVIPASMTFAAAVDRHLRVILILTGTGCKNDPMVVVDPVTAFRTVAVARGRNGGVAAISLAELSDKVPTTVRAYRNGRLVGQIALNRPVPTAPPPSPPPPTPVVRTVCRKPIPGVPQPMICTLRTFPPDATDW